MTTLAIFFYTSGPTQHLNQAKNIPVGLPSSPIKINFRQIDRAGFLIEHTNKQRLLLYVYIEERQYIIPFLKIQIF